MKQSILLVLFSAITLFTFGQKVKMTKEARKNYVGEAVIENESNEATAQNKMTVYAILRSESEIGSDYFQLSIDESSREIPTKAASMQFPELSKISRNKFSNKGEVDLLNYLAENGWEVVTIENSTTKRLEIRKFYLRKQINL